MDTAQYATDFTIHWWIGVGMGLLIASGLVWLSAMAFVWFYDWLGAWDDE